MVLRFPATAVAVTSALMLTVPFEALAETCESDNSFFNMPLLSFVALIGATVGGNSTLTSWRFSVLSLLLCWKSFRKQFETPGLPAHPTK